MPLTAGSQQKDYHALTGSEPDADWWISPQDANEGTPANAVIATQLSDLYKSAYKAATEKTVSSGVLTVDQSSHTVQPETGTSDDINTISGMKAHTFLVLYAADEGTDTLTFKHGTGNLSCFGAADVALSHGLVVCYYDGTVVYVSGGGGKQSQNDTVTTGNVTLIENTIHNQTIAGLTANRQNIFPVPSAVGKEITINILDGDASFVMIPIGAATVTINGLTSATALPSHYLFIKGETLTFISTSLTNWQIISDGRIPSKCRLRPTSAESIPHASKTTIAMSLEVYDVGNIGDLGNNRINVRRPNTYLASGFVTMNFVGAGALRFQAHLNKTNGAMALTEINLANVSDGHSSLVHQPDYWSITDYVDLAVYQTNGASAARNTQYSVSAPDVLACSVSLTEQLGEAKE